MIRNVIAILLLAGVAEAAETTKPSAHAKVEKPIKEGELGVITLTAEAEKRLGISLVPAERRKVERTRLFGGEIILPTSSGTGANPSVLPLLSSLTAADLVRTAQAQIDADGQVEQAKVQLNGAKVALTRAEQLLQAKAGSVRSVDEARIALGTAEVNLRTAQAKRELLGPAVATTASQPLLWVRVPVYAGDLGRLSMKGEARVGGLTDPAGSTTFQAKSVSAPPSANAAASSVDLFYELTNRDGTFRLGQRVGVMIPMREEEESLIVPWSGVVHDINGGAWVYENTGSLTYARRRVQVRRVSGSDALVASGVKPAAKIVASGAAELFGVEFGVGK